VNGVTAQRKLACGSLFSGYGGLDLAVEEVFDAETVWFSEVDLAAAKVYSRHWPGVPNLGDITAIDWKTVEPVDVICGGCPCQDCPRPEREKASSLEPAPASGTTWPPPSKPSNPGGSSPRTSAACSPPRPRRTRR
jgi:DNA (cytosine-5)-methyltransferase 1